MNGVGKGVLVVILLICTPLIAPAARQEAIWKGPDGNGGEGDWNTPSNWNLGVVPNNGTDADGDGESDVFDVRIDSLPAAVSFVRSDAPPAEIAGLRIDEGDTLELTQQPPFTLRDSDAHVEVVNNGLIRVGGRRDLSPMLAFRGDTLLLSGTGVIELGLNSSEHARLAALDGGRIINGATHAVRSTGLLQPGQINGYAPHVVTANVALTNDGLISAEQGGRLLLLLSEEMHFNAGTLQASDRAGLVLRAPGGIFHNSSWILAERQGQITLQDAQFVNEAGGVMRVDSGGSLTLNAKSIDAVFENAGVIEAANGGAIYVMGKNIANGGAGSVQIEAGGSINFSEGVFQTDPSIQLLSPYSTMVIDTFATIENSGRILSPGPGVLEIQGIDILAPAVVRGGELSSGEGTIIMKGGRLEDVYVRGTLTGTHMSLGGHTTFDPSFTFKPDGRFHIEGSPQPSLSMATDLLGGDALVISGDLLLNADSRLIVSGPGDGQGHIIAEYIGSRQGTFASVTPGYTVTYDDVNKWVSVEPIPEPASIVLAFAGAIAAVCMWLRNRKPGAGCWNA